MRMNIQEGQVCDSNVLATITFREQSAAHASQVIGVGEDFRPEVKDTRVPISTVTNNNTHVFTSQAIDLLS